MISKFINKLTIFILIATYFAYLVSPLTLFAQTTYALVDHLGPLVNANNNFVAYDPIIKTYYTNTPTNQISLHGNPYAPEGNNYYIKINDQIFTGQLNIDGTIVLNFTLPSISGTYKIYSNTTEIGNIVLDIGALSDSISPTVIFEKHEILRPNKLQITGTSSDDQKVIQTAIYILKDFMPEQYIEVLGYDRTTQKYFWFREDTQTGTLSCANPAEYYIDCPVEVAMPVPNVTSPYRLSDYAIQFPGSMNASSQYSYIFENAKHLFTDMSIYDVLVFSIDHAGNQAVDYDYFTYEDTTGMKLFRFWSDEKQGHFYTASPNEMRYVQANYPSNVWSYEGLAYQVSDCTDIGSSKVYRFWSDTKQHHFYTIDEAEKNYVSSHYPTNVWKYEMEAFCAYKSQVAGTQPVYRFWSDEKQSHFYTISENEKNYIIATYPTRTWKYEGIAYYAKP